eukprot:TRINITY_DN3187_c3_g1_i1.p1 TRINITY_DN3187_c3_g1~~TRINITY_DN3187_c3_g1_i1.p1  ORF type:complete len:152 (-),score=38.90 TRINITY_DN3187_c3_g1_i1:4-459(-)
MAQPRVKVALKPGRGLMHWHHLKRTTRDIAGTGGVIRPITKEELKQHNTEEDCWMAIDGRVFNVTPYLEYHPGGIPKLLLCKGRDGTKLFNKTHPWVNYESLLAECFVGPLVPSPSEGAAEAEAEEESEEVQAATMFPARDGPQASKGGAT